MPDVAEHPSNLPSFEDMMRYTADELIDLIVNEANSLEEVPAVIERAITYMRDQLLQVDWSEYDGEFGPIIQQRRTDDYVRHMLEDSDE